MMFHTQPYDFCGYSRCSICVIPRGGRRGRIIDCSQSLVVSSVGLCAICEKAVKDAREQYEKYSVGKRERKEEDGTQSQDLRP